jgi:hypothetical protein
MAFTIILEEKIKYDTHTVPYGCPGWFLDSNNWVY